MAWGRDNVRLGFLIAEMSMLRNWTGQLIVGRAIGVTSEVKSGSGFEEAFVNVGGATEGL